MLWEGIVFSRICPSVSHFVRALAPATGACCTAPLPPQRTLIPPPGPYEYIWLGFCRKDLCEAKHDAIVDNFVPKNPLAGGGGGKTAAGSFGVKLPAAVLGGG